MRSLFSAKRKKAPIRAERTLCRQAPLLIGGDYTTPAEDCQFAKNAVGEFVNCVKMNRHPAGTAFASAVPTIPVLPSTKHQAGASLAVKVGLFTTPNGENPGNSYASASADVEISVDFRSVRTAAFSLIAGITKKKKMFWQVTRKLKRKKGYVKIGLKVKKQAFWKIQK